MNFSDLLTLMVGPMPWLIGGCLLLTVSWLMPALVTTALGLAGLATAIAAASIVSLPSQLLIWGSLAAVFTLLMRGLSKALEAAHTARVCEATTPGELGRVHYEGALWHVRCQTSDVAIVPNTPVTVLERQGNTLILCRFPPLVPQWVKRITLTMILPPSQGACAS